MEKIKNHDTENIPTYVSKIWDFYHSFQYVSPNTPQNAVGSFEKMLEKRAEIGVASIPVWR
ncbi:cytochrome C, partial [Aliarcobacter butzleri]